jgi:hypothetical protein
MALFPLPLVPFEHYMLADDRADYPMTFFLRLHFQGRFDRARFEAAVKSALYWHPLLAARVEGHVKARTASLFWLDAAGSDPNVFWHPAGTRLECSQLYIDLFREPGLRLRFFESDDTTELLAQFHHSCCDGLGALQFVETLLEHYDLPGPRQPPPGWESRHTVRHQVGSPRGSAWGELPYWLGTGVSRIRRYLQVKPAPLAVAQEESGDGGVAKISWPALCSHQFDESETMRLRLAAKTRSVASNTLLVRDLFLALHDWNQSCGGDGSERALRVVMPVNLRDGLRDLPAFNAVSLAFIDRCPRELADAELLLTGINREIGVAKDLRRGLAFLPALRILGKFPHGMCGRLRDDRCLGSAVFSNLGVVLAGTRLPGAGGFVQTGNLVLTKFEAAPPVRPGTLASFAASIYCGALTITLCYDAHRLTADAGRAILDLFVRRVRSSAMSPQGRSGF